jgi:uncharacterized protein (UPF0276 family)
MENKNINLGIGVGLRPTHHQNFLKQKPKSIQWLEIISENYMPWTGKDFGSSISTLESIRKDFPIAMHGVSMNLGSVDPLDLDYLNRLKKLMDRIEPFAVSDHLSWTGMNNKNLHDLIPLPYTQEALNLFIQKVNQAQNFLNRQLLIENPSSYLEFQNSEMSETEFIVSLLKNTDCALLLDINNVYVSSVNHEFNPIEYLKQIPKDQVKQIHLAGHSDMDGYLIDTHDAPVCEEVWKLYEWSVQHFGLKNVMIERDGNIPEWNQMELELSKIGEIHEKFKKSI